MRSMPRKILHWSSQAAVAVLFIVVVALLMLWLSGWFSAKISPAASAGESFRPIPAGAKIVAARLIGVPITESAVGTIQAAHQTTIASRILGRVVQVDLSAGQEVKQGEVLIRLDDTDLKARLQQARAAAEAATAEYDQAVVFEKRYAALFQSKAVSRNDYDRALTSLRTTQANLAQANEAVTEAQAVLAYATINSPMDGVVVDKKVDVGDMATPGEPLVTIYDPHHMQLVASVRESLARRLAVGQEIGVRLDVLSTTCTARVSEIVPDAQSASRTFQVKVSGPCPPGLYTGMFGRIFIPLGEQRVLVIPRAAVRQVGQLELVDLAVGKARQRRAVRTGQIIGADCQVLSGLQAGEKVMVRPGAAIPATAPADQGVQP
jgi:RND family efflux transporter MFP subunit